MSPSGDGPLRGPREHFFIREVRATSVTIPLHAPLRHANGTHWGRFVRTLVEVETEDGLVGLGELGGGGQGAEAAVRAAGEALIGHDPFRLEQLRFKISNPTASLYNDRTQVLAALEFACLDLIGKRLDVSVSDLLGGRLRDRVPFASYLFFRYPAEDGRHEVRTVEQLVDHATELAASQGFVTHKLKGGVFGPDHELECYQALAASLPGHHLR
jgi:glucarate dehydratase